MWLVKMLVKSGFKKWWNIVVEDVGKSGK